MNDILTVTDLNRTLSLTRGERGVLITVIHPPQCTSIAIRSADVERVVAFMAPDLVRDLKDWRGSAAMWHEDHDAQKARADAAEAKLAALLEAIDAYAVARPWSGHSGMVRARETRLAYQAALRAARGEP